MTPDPYCEEKGAPTGSTAHYCRLFLPPPQQQAVTALYALRREVGSIVEDVSEIEAAHMKLAWWHAEIDRLYAGTPEHPVTRALRPFVEPLGLERDAFEQLLASAAMDIDHGGYARLEDLLAYVRSAAAAQRIESELCGYRESATREFAQQLGIGLQLVRLLREVRPQAARGRIYVPVEELDAHGVRPGELRRSATPEHVRALLARQTQRAREQLEHALQILPAIDHQAQVSALVGAAIQRRLLAEIEADGYRVLEHRIELTPVHKLWIAWRTARRARRASTRPRKHRV